jgi:hypothetical protein
MISAGKANAYKNHLIKNIEIIGQRKLAVIGGGADYSLLMETIDKLRKKNVRVPEIAFRVCIDETEAKPDEDIKFFDELKGKSSSYYALIVLPFSPAETQLAAMDGVVGCSQDVAEALKTVCGYSDRDFCQMNNPDGSGIQGSMGNMKVNGDMNADAKRSSAAANATAAQLSAYKGKMKGQRCFILGTHGAKLDELNAMMNERTFACNDFCELFTKTPLRPSYFLLTSMASYLGNGKYIEGMECFVNGDIKVFEDKFKKKPTYLSHLANGLIDGLPTFLSVQQAWDTARLLPMYEMLQLGMYMGFSEIYVYGFDGIFELEYTNGIGRKPSEGAVAGYPERAVRLLESVKTYAANNGTRIISMCETSGLSCFEKQSFGDVDFTASSIFSRI